MALKVAERVNAKVPGSWVHEPVVGSMIAEVVTDSTASLDALPINPSRVNESLAVLF